MEISTPSRQVPILRMFIYNATVSSATEAKTQWFKEHVDILAWSTLFGIPYLLYSTW